MKKTQKIQNLRDAEVTVRRMAVVRMSALRCASVEVRGPRVGFMRVKYYRADGTVIQTFWFRLYNSGVLVVKAEGAKKITPTAAFITVRFRTPRKMFILN